MKAKTTWQRALLALLLSLPIFHLGAAEKQPNIILIFADDLGWQEPGFAGSDFCETPHLDRLAREGTVFRHAYASAGNCQPSRACMLSGQYTARHGVYAVGSTDRGPKALMRMVPVPNRPNLPPATVTLGESLKAAGYATGFFGKCHMKDSQSHYFPPALAKLYGIDGAIVLRGLAWKVKRSKNDWGDVKGYYETLENLVKLRWPYYSPSGLWGTTTYLAKTAKVIQRGRNNRFPPDRTTWYSMDAALVKQALEEEGSIGFDVRIAIKHGVPAAIAYHHVRYHVREMIAGGATSEDLYRKVSKSALARSWHVDLATVKRAFKTLVSAGEIAKHPTKPKHYTIPQIGAFSNEIGANTNEAKAKTTGANPKETGAFANENGANPVSYTHWKPLEEHIQKHHSPHASRVVGGPHTEAPK